MLLHFCSLDTVTWSCPPQVVWVFLVSAKYISTLHNQCSPNTAVSISHPLPVSKASRVMMQKIIFFKLLACPLFPSSAILVF